MHKEVPDYFANRIKTISHFMQRFNGEDAPQYLDKQDADYDYKRIVTLFCLDSVQQRREEVVEFAHHMVDSGVKLGYADPSYYCELRCRATMNKTNHTIYLHMMVYRSPQDYYTWVIVGAEGEVLKVTPNVVNQAMPLSPVDDDRNFLDLRDALSKHPESILHYAHPAWHVDELSVFMALVASKQLKVEAIEDMHYVFDAGGYVFKVACFDRETNNNGWLIYDFAKHE